MKHKRRKSQQVVSEVTIRLKRHPVMEYCWDLVGDPAPAGTSGAGGFQSIQEMFSDICFLEMLQSHLGSDSVPVAVVEYARRRELEDRLPIPQEVVDGLRAKYGDLVTDLRTKPE